MLRFRAYVLLVATLLLPIETRAACTTSPNLGLQVCDFGDPSWNVFTNSNWGKVDFSFSSPLSRSGTTVSLGTVTEAKGGTGETTYSKGDLLLGDAGGGLTKLAVGANGTIPTADSSQTTGWKWAAATSKPPFRDDLAMLADATDPTKRVRFELGGLTTASERVVTVPDYAGTLAYQSGSYTTDHCIKYSGGAFVDSGAACSTATGDITDVWICASGNCDALTATSGDSFNAAAADTVVPWKTGTSPPATCSVGQAFFDTNESAGTNVYACTATDTWTLEGGGGGGGLSGLTTNKLLKAASSTTATDSGITDNGTTVSFNEDLNINSKFSWNNTDQVLNIIGQRGFSPLSIYDSDSSLAFKATVNSTGHGSATVYDAAGTQEAILSSRTQTNSATGGRLGLTAITFANLDAAADGSLMFCSDCTKADPCAGSGTGAFAKRQNGAWVCD